MHGVWRQPRPSALLLNRYYTSQSQAHCQKISPARSKGIVTACVYNPPSLPTNLHRFNTWSINSALRSVPGATTSTIQIPQHHHFSSRAASSVVMDHTVSLTPRKRKSSPPAAPERSSKQLKPPEPIYVSGDNTPNQVQPENHGRFPNPPDEIKEEKIITIAPLAAENAEWQATIEKVVRNVVSIHFCQTCSFDTDTACSSEATGFVVDAEKGYILTNRHVVCAGPFSGYCVFDNHEECDVHPVYRDPVHDFGILRFDPKAIKYMPLEALTLRPDLAKIGAEIRVVGNDAGEKLSILSGVISRLDRNAPEYGEGYSDFNTNYIQAAAAASGGSSGSPVINIDGYAVALQAGGRSDGAATDYFLPLDRPLRALQCLQRDEPVTRGTIQTQWMLKPFDECRRLGLGAEWEAAIRKSFPKETGTLVAEIVLPEGPADKLLEEGDVILKVNGELITQFIRLDEILDTHVGKKINILVHRGGEDMDFDLEVGNLHDITPDRFLQVAGGSFHDLSYQQARLYAIPVKGVFVCEAGGSFRFESSDSGWLIDTVDNEPTPNLDAFIRVMGSVHDRARVVVSYRHLRDLHTVNTCILHIDRHWYRKMRMAIRNDRTGLWDYSDLAESLPAVPPKPRSGEFPQMDTSTYTAAANIIRSFVRITCTIPVKIDGFPRARRVGFGLVVDADQGLVLVSRAIVPYDLCDISVTVADSIIVDGRVIFLHPLANYAIIKYDPTLVLAPVQTPKFATEMIKQGASPIFLGFNQNLRAVMAKTTVTDITTVAIPSNGGAPRYRALNLDAITVDTGLSAQCGHGVLLAEDGTVQGLWLTYLGERHPTSFKDTEYHLGLATPGILPIIEQIRGGTIPELRILNIEPNTILMAQARIMGVSDEWISKVAIANPARHQLFMVRKIDCADGVIQDKQSLQEGDVILTLNDQLITRVSELDIMYDSESLSALVVRKGKELKLTVPTIPTTDLNTSHVVMFCGAVLHRPHHAVRQQISKLHSEVYVSARSRGSPSYMYGLAPTNFITAVNGVKTHTLNEFLTEVNKIPDNVYFRMRVVTFDDIPWVATMKKNEHYFPTMEFIRNKVEGKSFGEDYEWVKRVIETTDSAGHKVNGVADLSTEAMDESADGGADTEDVGSSF